MLMKKKILILALMVALIGGLAYFAASYLWHNNAREEAWILWRLWDGLILIAAILFIYGLIAKEKAVA